MRVLVSFIGAAALALSASTAQAGAQAPGYDETRNWLNAYGQTLDHLTDPELIVGGVTVSLRNVLSWVEEVDRVLDRGVQQTGAFPWDGDVDRGSYGQRGDWTGTKIEFEFRNRTGHALKATVWGPSGEMLAAAGLSAPLPGLVYSGGVISSQPMYYWFAQEMARSGYVVMTYDVTGQGRSEGLFTGDAPNDLRDALDFFTSTPDSPYPRQIGGVGHNPLWQLLDRDRIGTAGHSMGAGAVQTVVDHCGVVKAISAHSDLGPSYAAGAGSTPAGACGPRSLVPIQGQGADYETFIFPPVPTPGTDPDEKLPGFRAARDAGIDAQEVVIESGSHLAWSHVTGAYTASWSEPVAFHYALAWFDRYLYDDMERAGRSGTERLTEVFDATGQGHGVSKKYRSAYDVSALDPADPGRRYACDDMVAGTDCTAPGTAVAASGTQASEDLVTTVVKRVLRLLR